MTYDEYQILKNRAVFAQDYRGRPLLTDPDVRKNTKASIVNLMDDIVERLKPCGAGVVIHCLYEPDGHTANSQHYKGLACDFHLTGNGTYIEQIRAVEKILREAGISHAVGFGIYPKSRTSFLHLDLRGEMARWAGVFRYRDDGGYSVEYIGYDEGILIVSTPGYRA